MNITCNHCRNGVCPLSATRHGRASYSCPVCGRDVSLVVFMLADAGHDVPIIAAGITTDNRADTCP